MPYSHIIDTDLNLIFYFVAGVVTAKELVGLETKTFNDPARRPNMQILIDLKLASVDMDVDSIKSLLSKNRELERVGWELEKTVVITQNRLYISLAQAYELMGSDMPLKLKVCSSLDEAIHWLELDDKADQVKAIRDRLQNEAMQRS